MALSVGVGALIAVVLICHVSAFNSRGMAVVPRIAVLQRRSGAVPAAQARGAAGMVLWAADEEACAGVADVTAMADTVDGEEQADAATHEPTFTGAEAGVGAVAKAETGAAEEAVSVEEEAPNTKTVTPKATSGEKKPKDGQTYVMCGACKTAYVMDLKALGQRGVRCKCSVCEKVRTHMYYTYMHCARAHIHTHTHAHAHTYLFTRTNPHAPCTTNTLKHNTQEWFQTPQRILKLEGADFLSPLTDTKIEEVMNTVPLSTCPSCLPVRCHSTASLAINTDTHTTHYPLPTTHYPPLPKHSSLTGETDRGRAEVHAGPHD